MASLRRSCSARKGPFGRHLIGKNETADAAPEEDTSEDAQEPFLIKVREDQKKLGL